MAFSPKLLNEGEEIALDLRPHWWVFATPSLVLGVGLIVGILIAANVDVTVVDWAMALAVLAALGWVGWVYLEWASTNFVVTNRRVIYRSGVLNKRGIEIPLNRVNNVISNQRLWERALGAGDLVIESAGESGQQFFSNVRKPAAVQNEIYRQIQAYEDRHHVGQVQPPVHAPAPTPGGATGSPPESIPDQIARLAELRDSGLITAEEFDRKKAELLDRM